MELIRLCPDCGCERSINEIYCQNIIDDRQLCNWSLVDVAPSPRQTEEVTSLNHSPSTNSNLPIKETSKQNGFPRCTNGHQANDGDLMCGECGAEVIANFQQESRFTMAEHTIELVVKNSLQNIKVDRWEAINIIQTTNAARECFSVKDSLTGKLGFLSLYKENHEPDIAIYDVLHNTKQVHIPKLLQIGRLQNRAFEIFEWITEGTLESADLVIGNSTAMLHTIVYELATALHDLANVGIRLRNLSPRTISIRQFEPLDLVITDFSSARLSDYDLDTVAVLELNRYSAPETIVGGVSVASDWWSLGMILMELLTEGQCFADINDKAFMIHIVTRGVVLPNNLDERTLLLLRGLLARDPLQRWQWEQVKRWLDGEIVEAPIDSSLAPGSVTAHSITLGKDDYTNPCLFALTAAEEKNWLSGIKLFESGEIATWVLQAFGESRLLSRIRKLQSLQEIELEWRFALTLMHLNQDLPLTYNGQIITPAWLLDKPKNGYRLVTGKVPLELEVMERDAWLVRLHYREIEIKKRAKLLEIELDDERYVINILVTSRANLEAQSEATKKQFPASNHSGLALLLDKKRLNEQDLILLLSAALHQFIPVSELIEEAVSLAERYNIECVDAEFAHQWLQLSKRDIYAAVDKRIHGFARCNLVYIDGWADNFRIERRISLVRAIVILGVPEAQWIVPDKQHYAENILKFFEKRVTSSVLRGPLVRLTISKTSSRIDLTELNTRLKPAEDLLNHILERTDVAITVDPNCFQHEPYRERRIWRLINDANNYRRDTGIDSLYLGFPFLLSSDASRPNARPRIIPVLLWPVRLEFKISSQGGIALSFDKDREEVRLNPALERIVGASEIEKWKKCRQQLLGQQNITINTVMDIFGGLISPLNTQLTSHPSVNYKMDEETRELECSAVIFNARFSGQAIAEDLYQLRSKPLTNTVLETLLKITEPEELERNFSAGFNHHKDSLHEKNSVNEKESSNENNQYTHYAVVPSDPSQDSAVQQARNHPGLVIEGPPGTGKSQTIVNIIADCLGRGENVLVVCEKQAALKVVEKRLRAENLGNRLLSVTNINRDRQSIIRTIREQLDNLSKRDLSQIEQIENSRNNLAGEIENLERHFDQRHQAMYQLDDISGLTYRQLITELIHLESHSKDFDLIKIPSLQKVLAEENAETVNKICDNCMLLVNDWLLSGYESSKLDIFKPFSVVKSEVDTLTIKFNQLRKLERQRKTILERYASGFNNNDIYLCQSWLDHNSQIYKGLSDVQIKRINLWYKVFVDGDKESSIVSELLTRLKKENQKLSHCDVMRHDDKYFIWSRGQSVAELKDWLADFEMLLGQKSFFQKLNPLFWLTKSKVNKVLLLSQENLSDNTLDNLINVCQLEINLKPIRRAIKKTLKILRIKKVQIDDMDLLELKHFISDFIDDFSQVRKTINGIKLCPLAEEAKKYLVSGSSERFNEFFVKLEGGLKKHKIKEKQTRFVDSLCEWIDSQWLDNYRKVINDNKFILPIIEKLIEQLPNLPHFQKFRNLSQALSPAAFDALAQVRSQQDWLLNIDSDKRAFALAQLIKREAMLGWKNRIETDSISLQQESNVLQQQLPKLDNAINKMVKLNRLLLSDNFDSQCLGSKKQWREITGLRGVRYKKLREFFDLGTEIGLMSMRPIWLMSPDVVSQVLPLKAGLFDLVIFDEASQIMVDSAIPCLYRAKRVVISGDEKQMPPTSFFSSRIESDEIIDGELDEDASEAEVTQYEESWNRREIKDCPDLLVLGKAVLPSQTLQIHYRSQYRALIDFSNSAFYAQQLYIPVHRSEKEVIENKPIEVHSVMGIYNNQSNQSEAERIVQILQEYWREPYLQRPSIGVVTFNKKQAELLEDALQSHSENNPEFYQAYLQEQDRTQGEEDMGFFVKNVENVQGDERDVILFSTTFGRNEQGAFRRNFGALGHRGGERRLNVAITRARKKVIIVTSMPIKDVSDMLSAGRSPTKPRDYLQAYLEYSTHVSDDKFLMAKRIRERFLSASNSKTHLSTSEDAFILSIEEYLIGLGYQPVKASNNNDIFGIDLAIENPTTSLYGFGIICDSPNAPLLQEAKYREIWRYNLLTKSVPVLYRLSSRDWYHNMKSEKQKIKLAIEKALN
ncbi:AAA domain-containing protein [Aliikangiella sp. IMCC44359]|uniref:AAA domain-containing protein n=1 Tax=Aliikangiella sp. IMCC44359 TaxID=3459125 RepID=UPI00403B20FF